MTSDEVFYKHLEETNLLKKSSKNLYIKRLTEIQNEFFTKKPTLMWLIKNPDKFKTALLSFGERSKNGRLSKKLSKNTLSLYCIPIISLLINFRDIQEEQPDILRKWKDLKDEIADNENVMNNEPSSRQKKALLTFDEIVKIRDGLPDGSDAKLIISLYTMIAPIRSNFDNVRIYKTKPTEEVNENFIITKQKKFFLKNYKTDKIYGTNIIKLPDELMKQINLSLKAKPRDYLFVQKTGKIYTPTSWNLTANRILKKIFNNKDFSINMFRHIYLSQKDLNLKDKTLKEKKEIADQMGHSVSTQSKYYWKDEGKAED
jgi:hypothetical protein